MHASQSNIKDLQKEYFTKRIFFWLVFHSSGRGHLYARSSQRGEKRQTPLNDQSKWNEHESQVEYRKAHSQQKANLLFPLAEKPVRDFSGRREKNGRERKLFLLVFHLPDSCSQGRKLLGIKRQTLLLPFSYVKYSSTL